MKGFQNQGFIQLYNFTQELDKIGWRWADFTCRVAYCTLKGLLRDYCRGRAKTSEKNSMHSIYLNVLISTKSTLNNAHYALKYIEMFKFIAGEIIDLVKLLMGEGGDTQIWSNHHVTIIKRMHLFLYEWYADSDWFSMYNMLVEHKSLPSNQRSLPQCFWKLS